MNASTRPDVYICQGWRKEARDASVELERSVVLSCAFLLPGWAAAGEDPAQTARSLVCQTQLDAAAEPRSGRLGLAGMESVLALSEAEPELAKSPAFHAALDARGGEQEPGRGPDAPGGHSRSGRGAGAR